jgi:hypothetical protein
MGSAQLGHVDRMGRGQRARRGTTRIRRAVARRRISSRLAQRISVLLRSELDTTGSKTRAGRIRVEAVLDPFHEIHHESKVCVVACPPRACAGAARSRAAARGEGRPDRLRPSPPCRSDVATTRRFWVDTLGGTRSRSVRRSGRFVKFPNALLFMNPGMPSAGAGKHGESHRFSVAQPAADGR